MLRKVFILLFSILLVPILLGAQSKSDKREKIEQIKIEFITQKVELSSSESKAFWPLYNDFQQKREHLRMQRDESLKAAMNNTASYSEKDFEKFTGNELTYKQKEVDLQKDFQNKMKLIMPSKKIAKYYLAEEEFKRKLAEIIRQK